MSVGLNSADVENPAPDCASRALVVDIHAHTVVPAVWGLVGAEKGFVEEQRQLDQTFGPASSEHNRWLANGPYVAKLADLSTRLEAMDASGIDVQAVSVIPTQYHYWADEDLAARIVTTVNEHIAGLVTEAPGRLVGFATVSLQHPDLAAEQLDHAVTALGMRGAEICTAAGGRELSDPAYEPLWSAAESLGTLLFVHPWGCSLGERLSSFYLGNVIGNPTETTLALSHLVFAGVLDRHPGLLLCGAHGGGYLPHYIGRADHAWSVRPESHTCTLPPSSYLSRLYFDSLVYRADTLRHLVEQVGASQVLLGSDYPFDMSVENPLERLDAAGLPTDVRRQIAGTTAARLLHLDAQKTR